MGNAKSVPVVGEVVTVAESGAKIVSAGVVKVVGEIADDDDLKDAAGNLAKGAGEAWVDYSERNIIAAPTRAVIHKIDGNSKEANRVMSKCGDSVEGLVDNTPVVGHVKGIVHYATGDEEHGDRCMKGATRTTAVIGAGVLTGGAGAIVGGVAGSGAGIGYDVIVSEKTGEDYGTVAAFSSAKHAAKKKDATGYFNNAIDLMGSVGADFVMGSTASQVAEG